MTAKKKRPPKIPVEMDLIRPQVLKHLSADEVVGLLAAIAGGATDSELDRVLAVDGLVPDVRAAVELELAARKSRQEGVQTMQEGV